MANGGKDIMKVFALSKKDPLNLHRNVARTCSVKFEDFGHKKENVGGGLGLVGSWKPLQYYHNQAEGANECCLVTRKRHPPNESLPI
jgi:hypothetical protein